MTTPIKLHKYDPAHEIREKVGDLSKVEVLHNQILVGIYIRPEKTAGGIYLSDTTRGEDKYQGKVGLVLKKGPLAFVDDAHNKFHGQNVEAGQWCFFRVSDGFSFMLNGHLCRLLEEVHIKGIIPSPGVVY
jgi:co-chaperonin GroES (HSP10)